MEPQVLAEVEQMVIRVSFPPAARTDRKDAAAHVWADVAVPFAAEGVAEFLVGPRGADPKGFPALPDHDSGILAPKDGAGPGADRPAAGHKAAVAVPEAELAAIDVLVGGVPGQSAALSYAARAAPQASALVTPAVPPARFASAEE